MNLSYLAESHISQTDDRFLWHTQTFIITIIITDTFKHAHFHTFLCTVNFVFSNKMKKIYGRDRLSKRFMEQPAKKKIFFHYQVDM